MRIASCRRGRAPGARQRFGRCPSSRSPRCEERMMSRHILTPRPGQPEIVAIVVGWDRPLQTFFAQVFARTEAEPDGGEATIWVGTVPGEPATKLRRAAGGERGCQNGEIQVVA